MSVISILRNKVPLIVRLIFSSMLCEINNVIFTWTFLPCFFCEGHFNDCNVEFDKFTLDIGGTIPVAGSKESFQPLFALDSILYFNFFLV